MGGPVAVLRSIGRPGVLSGLPKTFAPKARTPGMGFGGVRAPPPTKGIPFARLFPGLQGLSLESWSHPGAVFLRVSLQFLKFVLICKGFSDL